MDSYTALLPRRLIGALLGLALLVGLLSACGTVTTPTAAVSTTPTPKLHSNLPINPPEPTQSSRTPLPTRTPTPVPPTPTATPIPAPPGYLSAYPTSFHITSSAQAQGCQGSLSAGAGIRCQTTIRSNAPVFISINWFIVNITSGISFSSATQGSLAPGASITVYFQFTYTSGYTGSFVIQDGFNDQVKVSITIQ